MQTAIEQAIDEGKAHGHIVYGALLFPNPKDAHLVKVLVLKPAENEFVVWTFNTQDGGFHNGHYFGTWEDAVQGFVEAGENLLGWVRIS